MVELAIIKAGLANKDYSVHTMRHSFATHLVDNGTDLHTVKELLGHNSLTTTLQYLHMSNKRIRGIVNPYDLLDLAVVKSFNLVAGSNVLHHTL